jgi:hypothetical protein
MKITIQLYKDRKEQIKSMFSRTIVEQKPKIESNKRIYRREKYKGDISGDIKF